MRAGLCVAGINIFLDGYIPAENLRFRDSALTFRVAERAAAAEGRASPGEGWAAPGEGRAAPGEGRATGRGKPGTSGGQDGGRDEEVRDGRHRYHRMTKTLGESKGKTGTQGAWSAPVN